MDLRLQLQLLRFLHLHSMYKMLRLIPIKLYCLRCKLLPGLLLQLYFLW